ncbi:MAG: hypothetical protein AMJ59_06455 [Gammaproteobacteria bacterium SG8_31]|nr:MAG: hypothetical protein AMJ59_06455 [Gammaproteobacteria bacterium SG8_31]
MVVLIVGILLALAADRWNQDRLDRIETAQIVERLKSDTARNLAMFGESLALMERNLANVKALFRALEAGTMVGEDPAHIESAIAYIDVVPSYPLVFAGYDELVATGRLRELDDPTLIDLLGNQRAEYEAGQAVVGYWRDSIQGASDALDRHVDFYYTTEDMDEDGMGVRFDFAALVSDRDLKNKVFDAVDIHGDWLRLQTSVYEITKNIDARLNAK